MAPRRKNTHCSYCGVLFAADLAWPRECGGCTSVTYLNPTPVGVALVPVDGGLLCVRRTIEPGLGELSFPGGYLEGRETWQEGCAREVFEETGLRIDPGELALYQAHSVRDAALLLLFAVAATRTEADLPAFVANSESSEMRIVREPMALAFPLHAKVMADWFAGLPKRRG